MAQQAKNFEKRITKKVHLDYLLHLPKGYQAGSKHKWPLILFLHGRGERGDDLEVIKKHGLPRLLDDQPDFPFVVISPQCPIGDFWPHLVDALKALLDMALDEYDVDRKRVYLTGLSMGGYGTWHLAASHPDYFAAIAPICGGGDPANACALKDVPIWAFHGAKDRIVLPRESRMMVKAVRACGGDVKLTIYPEADHDSWTPTYANPELYDWFLQHSR